VANGEDNQDGESHNRSWNSGAEGPTADPEIRALRARQHRNFIATMLLSQGVPMILHGDELGRTQQGNNNTYAQDNELSWIDWDEADLPLVEFTAAVSRLRKEHPTFRRRRFFDGHPGQRAEGTPLADIVWLSPDGAEMRPQDWDENRARTVGMFLNGDSIRERDVRGEPVTDVNFLLCFNADPEDVDFTLPNAEYARSWEIVVDTAGSGSDPMPHPAGERLTLPSRSLLVLRAYQPPEAAPDHSVAASLASRFVPQSLPPFSAGAASPTPAEPTEGTAAPTEATPPAKKSTQKRASRAKPKSAE